MCVQPCVSVVMPIYNAEPFLRQALDSICAQTLENIEIICVNDGSKDSSLEIMQSYALKDRRITIIDKANGGYGHTMNKGLAAATGEYVGILEPDDYLKPSMFERLYNRAKIDDLDFVRSNYYRFYTDENGIEHFTEEKVCNKGSYYNKTLSPQDNLDLFNIRMENWTGIYKNSWLKLNEIRFNESPGAAFQDNGFWFQTYCLATKIAVLDEAFYCYRQDNAASSINQSNKVFTMLDEYSWIENWLDCHPELRRKYIGIFEYKKTHNCEFAFSRLSPEFQLPFMERYAKEYRKAFEQGDVDESFFWPNELSRLIQITEDPKKYVLSLNNPENTNAQLKDAQARGHFALFKYYTRTEGVTSALKRTIMHIMR